MKLPPKDIRWRLVVGAAASIIALSLLTLMGKTTIYALILAFQIRGSPDQAAINHFAANVSRGLMPWLQCFFALVVAIPVARRTGTAAAVNGALTGITAGLLGVGIALAFGGRFNLHMAGLVLATAGLGWLGAILGRRTESLP